MKSRNAISISLQDLLNLRTKTIRGRPFKPTNPGWQTGAFAGRRRGQSSDYDDLRLYIAGDDIRHMDWRASARTGVLHTRLYRDEKDHRIMFVADLRASMFTGSQRLRSVVACELAATLLWQASNGGSRINVLCFSDERLTISEPGIGSTAAIHACRLIADEFQQTQNSLSGNSNDTHLKQLQGAPTTRQKHTEGGTSSLESVLRWTRTQPVQRCTVIWISGMDNPGNQFMDLLGAAGNKDKHAFISLYEPLLDVGLPQGCYRYQAIHKEAQARSITIDRTGAKQLRDLLRSSEQRLADQFSELKLPYLQHADGSDDVSKQLRMLGYLP